MARGYWRGMASSEHKPHLTEGPDFIRYHRERDAQWEIS
jgi:hypothetical protein